MRGTCVWRLHRHQLPTKPRKAAPLCRWLSLVLRGQVLWHILQLNAGWWPDMVAILLWLALRVSWEPHLKKNQCHSLAISSSNTVLSPCYGGGSVAQLCPTLCDSMNCSTPDLLVLHHLPELAQTHVHWVSDAIQPSHPLSSPSPPAFSLSQHQGLF